MKNGRELAREYFETWGKPMLEKEFPEVLPYLAAGFTGSGSEHYGFDDETSRDHDFEPGFCIFLPGEDVVDRRTEFLLLRAYNRLPQEFGGAKRLTVSPVGGSRSGIKRTAEFFREKVGSEDGILSGEAWLRIPDHVLSEAVNGEVYFDNYGEFTRIRKTLENMPRDIRLKRIAGNLLVMGQSGQYNFGRCLSHGEPEAAQLSVTEFVTAAMKVIFLANGKYMPYYKWSFRALRELLSEIADPMLSDVDERLSFLLCRDTADPETAAAKKETIEETAAVLSELLRKKGMLTASGSELEPNAYAVNELIKDAGLRGENIFAGV